MVTLLLVGGQAPPLTPLRTGPAQIDTRTKSLGEAATSTSLTSLSALPPEEWIPLRVIGWSVVAAVSPW
jgi:hypothetical protein